MNIKIDGLRKAAQNVYCGKVNNFRSWLIKGNTKLQQKAS
jgi:hypothetical protein